MEFEAGSGRLTVQFGVQTKTISAAKPITFDPFYKLAAAVRLYSAFYTGTTAYSTCAGGKLLLFERCATKQQTAVCFLFISALCMLMAMTCVLRH